MMWMKELNSFPPYAVLSEEEKDDTSRLDNDYCFIVDSLDGTKEFIKRNGQFTVNIALAYGHEAVMGVIYVPVTDKLYYAAKGYGSFVESPKEKSRRLSVSHNTEIGSLRVVMSNSHGCRQMDGSVMTYNRENCVNEKGFYIVNHQENIEISTDVI